jgi:hypothetical protein
MNSPLTMSNGKGPTSQIASANLTVALYEWRFRRAHKIVKTAQVTNGRGADRAIASFLPDHAGRVKKFVMVAAPIQKSLLCVC